MRLQLSRGNVLFLGSIGVALLALLFTLVLRPFPHSQVPATPISHIIQNENAHLGTSSWQVPYDNGATTQIQAYAGATSVSPGQKLALYVSTRKEGNYIGAQATGNGLPAKTAASAASMECPCLCIVER